MSEFCPRCQLGHLQREKSTYVKLHGEKLICVPHSHVYRCDVCGYQEYDILEIQQLYALIGQSENDTDSDEQPLSKSTNYDRHDLNKPGQSKP